MKKAAKTKRAVVLLSGGLDSATTLAIALQQGYETYCLGFHYGQRNRAENDAAKKVAAQLGATSLTFAEINLRLFGGSALTSDTPVPKDGIDIEGKNATPPTYVPARNTIFLSHALAYAETIEAGAIFIGVNAVDYSGYPDCRAEFIAAFNQVAKLGIAGQAVAVIAPLQHMDKSEIIRAGLELGVDYALTLTCYDPNAKGRPCQECASCRLRAQGFAKAGAPDPALAP